MLTYITNRYDLTMPTLAKLPEYFGFTKYEVPTDSSHCPMTYAVGQNQFDWMANHKKQQNWFNSFMSSRREGKPNWFDVYPVEKLIEDIVKYERSLGLGDDDDHDYKNAAEGGNNNDESASDRGTAFLVDVGGNKGHDLKKLRQKFDAHLPGPLILQDLPTVLESIGSDDADGLTRMAYNFWDPQPVKGVSCRLFLFAFFAPYKELT